MDNNKTLQELLPFVNITPPEDIPTLVRLLENPQSPLPLPGKISLYNHDCLHILLNQKISSSGEAFVIGFTMGNDPKTLPIHVNLFKFCSRYLYPHSYRFYPKDFYFFDFGFNYGKSLKIQFNRIDFSLSQNIPIVKLRQQLGISEQDLGYHAWIKNKYKYYNYKRAKSSSKKNKNSVCGINNILKISSSLFGLIGGLLLAANTSWSGYGFILLACSSSQMLMASIYESNFIMIFYSTVLFLCVDLLGIYCWLIS